MATATGQVLTLLRDGGPASRADLARASGLSSASLSKAAAVLMEQGILDEGPAEGGAGPGRPSLRLALRPRARAAIGIHLSPGRASVALTDVLLGLCAQDSLDFDLALPPEDLAARTARLAQGVIEAAGLPRARLLGVGIGVPGGVDRTQRVNTHSAFTNWSDIPFADMFEQALGLPATLEHNATAIALAEALFAEDRVAGRTLHILMGKGIGAGLAEHSPGLGADPARGPVEIGHIVLDPDGAPCRCGGRGCLETVFAEQPLLAQAGLAAVPPEGLVAAAMAGAGWPALYGRFLHALATTVTLLAPQRIVLGGHLARAPEALFEDLRRDLPARVMPQQRVGLTIARTGLEGPVGARGAACVALERFFYRNGPAATLRLARAARG